MSGKSLKNVELKISYNPCVDGTDLINEVYIPCLSNSIRYDRLTAYFSSSVLKNYAAGLSGLFKNGGHARYIFSSEIDKKELEEIVNAYNGKTDLMVDKLNDQDLENDYNIANLSYLIKHNLVDIKIAFMVRDQSAIMHIKNGLFEDAEGNKVFFTGSGNETENGIINNAEFFITFNNFKGEDEHINVGEDMFEKLWNNTYSPSSIITVTPEGKLFEKLISYDKGRVFDTQDEYDTFIKNLNCLYIDIDIEQNEIIIEDFTENKIVKNPKVGILALYKNRIVGQENDVYRIKKITSQDLKETIPNRASRYNKEIIYSKRAEEFLEQQDLNLEQTIKLARRVKDDKDEDLWMDNYNNFKNVIDQETVTKLKEEQYKNAYHHYCIKSAMDFSVPGTGKTYISYGLFAFLNSKINKDQDVDHLVVFGPLNCFNAWKEECTKIFGPRRFKIFDVTEKKDEFEREIKSNSYNIYLINYEFLTDNRRITLISKYLINNRAMVVFDEIHRIKAVNGVRASNVLKLINDAIIKPQYKLALTGTPIPNSFLDLKNYIELLYSDNLDNLLIDFSEDTLKKADTNIVLAKRIQESLYPLFMRVTKKDLKIPPANEDDLSSLNIAATEEEEMLYEYVYKSYKNPLVKFIRLIQASSNPKLLLEKIDADEINAMYDDGFSYNFDEMPLYGKEIRDIVGNINMSSKTKATLMLIEEKALKGKKIIVWCLFRDTINLVCRELRRHGIRAVDITGSDNLNNRNKKLNSFKNGDIQVLVTNPNTLAESISLHMVCHDAVYLEYGFNLTYMLQSKDRIHRVGLPEGTETNYYYAITNSKQTFGSIDKRIYERLDQKAIRMENAIESNDIIYVSNPSDRDEIIDLIKDMEKQTNQ